MLFSSKNTKLKINDIEVLARDCSLSLSSSTAARFDSKDRRSNSFVADKGVSSSLSFSYYMTRNDQEVETSIFTDPIRKFELLQGELNDGQDITGDFGGLKFEKGYLSSYSVDFQPNSPVVVSCEIVFFSDLEGEFEESNQIHEKNIEDIIDILNCKDAEIQLTDSPEELVDGVEFLSASYSYSCDVKPVYASGGLSPERIYFGRKSSSMNISITKDKGNLDYSGLKAGFSVSLNDKSGANITSLICNGIIQSKSIQASSGDRVKYNLNLISFSSSKKIENPVLKPLITTTPLYLFQIDPNLEINKLDQLSLENVNLLNEIYNSLPSAYLSELTDGGNITHKEGYIFNTSTIYTDGANYNYDFWGYNFRKILDTTGVSFLPNHILLKEAGWATITNRNENGAITENKQVYYGGDFSSPPTKTISRKAYHNSTLITPWHVMTSTHTAPEVGSYLHWYDANGVCSERKIEDIRNLGEVDSLETDITIAKLDSPLNTDRHKVYSLGILKIEENETVPKDSFPIYCVLGVDYLSQNGSKIGDLVKHDCGLGIYSNVALTNQSTHIQAIDFPLNVFDSSLPNIKFSPPTLSSGDSSGPMFVILDNEPVVISLTWKAGAFVGSFLLSSIKLTSSITESMGNIIEDMGDEGYKINVVEIN